MAKISDIWVRLGLKKDGYDKGMKDAGKKAEGFGATLGKMKTGALAVWAAIGSAVLKFSHDLIESTNRMGDAWAVFTAQSKAAWDTFLSSISSWDFKDFFSRLREATSGAAAFAKALDSEFEVSNSIRLQRAAMSEELAALRIVLQDATKPFEDRIKAGKKYIADMTPIYDQILAQAKRMEDAHLGKWLDGTGLEDSEQVRADLRKFLVEIGKNTDLYDQLSALLSAQTTIDKGPNFLGSNYGKLNAAYSERGKLLGQLKDVIGSYDTPLLDLFRVYNNMRGDKDTAPLIDAMVSAFEASAMKNEQTREIQSVINGLINQQNNALLAEQEKKAAEFNALIDNVRTNWEDTVEVFDVEIEMPEIDLSALDRADERIKQFLENWQEEQRRIAELNGMLEDSLRTSMSNGLQAIMDMMVGVQGADMKGVLASFIAPFGDMAKNMGALIMSWGYSVDAFKKAFQTPGGGALAIAAGAGLMAIGSLISAGAARIASGSMGGGGSTAYAGSSSAAPELQNYESTLTVYVEGRVSGSDIILAGQNQQNKWNR